MNSNGQSVNDAHSLRTRIMRWHQRPAAARALAIRSRIQRLWGTFFRAGLSAGPVAYQAFQPDSYFLGREHREFEVLFRRFTAHNRLNNGGDATRLWSLMLNCKQILSENVVGDFAEVGVWRGNTAAVLAHYAFESSRQVFLFDTFEGFDRRDMTGIDADKLMGFSDTSMDLVRSVLGPSASHCQFVKGRFPESVRPDVGARTFAAVSLDCDLYEPMREGLRFFYPRMPRGGIFFLHDYSSLGWNGAKKAVDEFCDETGEFAVLMPDKSGSAFVRKSREAGSPG